MASANFLVNGSATPPEMAVSASSTVTLALTSTSGVRTVVWSIVGNSSPLLVNPTITPAGSPLGATATFPMPAGTGQAYLVQCKVNGGTDDEGIVQSDLTKRAIIGVVNTVGFVPFCAGETYERDAVYGYTVPLNDLGDAGGGTASIADNSVTFAKIQDIGVGLIGNDTGTADPKLITLGTGLAFVAGALAVSGVTLASLGSIAANSIVGNNTGGSAVPTALTGAQATALLSAFVASGASHAKGLVPDPGSSAGTTKFLREDSTWSVPAGSFTSPANPGDNAKIAYASAGALAYASAIKTDGIYLAFGVDPAVLTIGVNRYAHATHVLSGLGSDGTTNYDLVQWGVGSNNRFLLGSSTVAITELQGKQIKAVASAQSGTALTPTMSLTGGAHTTLTASTEVSDFLLDLAQTKQWSTGALTTQRAARITAPTIAFVGASVAAMAATLAISGAPAAGTNATLTNSLALWVESGAVGYGSAATMAKTGLQRFGQSATMQVAQLSGGTDVNLSRFGVTATDEWTLGDDALPTLKLYATTSVGFRIGANAEWDFTSTQLDAHNNNIVNLLGLNGVRVATGTLGTALADANVTLSVAGGGVYELQANLSANRSIALAITGSPRDKQVISIRKYTTAAFNLTVTDEVGNPLYTFPQASKGIADFQYSSATSKFVLAGNMDLA
jgi:hypothetical protein